MSGHLIGLVGADLSTSLSAALFEAEADALGLRLVYRLLDTDRLGEHADLGALVRMAWFMGFTGLDVTYPCKRSLIPHLDGLDADATALDAVNMVSYRDGRSTGHNTDGHGFATAVRAALPGATLDRVVLLGAGGAGSAVAHALLAMGVAHLVVVDVDTARAAGLVTWLAGVFPRARVEASGDPAEAMTGAPVDGLVNATPIGMQGHPGAPLPLDLLTPRLWVVDVIYRPFETVLLGHARTLGCRTANGGGMLVHQAAAGFRLLTGHTPDAARMTAHFRAVTR